MKFKSELLKNITPADTLLYACLCFIIGVGVVSYLPDRASSNELYWLSTSIFFFTILILVWKCKLKRIMFLAFFLFCLAGWRYSLSFPVTSMDSLWNKNGDKVRLVGRVVSEPSVSQTDQKLVVESSQLLMPNRESVRGRVLVVTGTLPEYQLADELEIACRLARPKKIEDFNYDRYLAKDKIYSICYQPDIVLLGNHPNGWSQKFLASILKIKNQARQSVNRVLAGESAQLVNGMVLGDQRGIGKDTQNDYSRSGLSHVVAISGMNMTILTVMFVEMMLIFGMSRRTAVLGAGLFIWLYTIGVGLPASAVRAAILSSFYLLSVAVGRLSELPRGLALAGAWMLLANPRLLRDDMGFILSFLAFLGVAYLVPIMESWRFWPKEKMPLVRELIFMTIAAQFLVWPILASSFGQVSLIAPVANVMVIWTLPLIMGISLVALVLIPVWLPAGQGLMLLAGWLVYYVSAVAHWLGRMPWSSIEVSRLSWLVGVIYYMAILWIMWRFYNNKLVNDII